VIFSAEDKFLFIHIPRTGGTSITAALAGAYPRASVDAFAGKHATGLTIRGGFWIDDWESLFRFTVVRNPWEIIGSDYRWTLARAREMDETTYMGCDPIWLSKMRRTSAYRDFADFVWHEYLGEWGYILPGGFWRTYCLDFCGHELGIETFRFEELDRAWETIRRRVGTASAELPRLNVGDGSVTWTRPLTEAVRALCWIDADRFGYRGPACGGEAG
jgi:hypothetical protein